MSPERKPSDFTSCLLHYLELEDEIIVCCLALSCRLCLLIPAIDRSISSSLSDARDALVNAVVDLLTAYKSNVSNLQQSGLVLPAAMRLFPLYILALLKQV